LKPQFVKTNRGDDPYTETEMEMDINSPLVNVVMEESDED